MKAGGWFKESYRHYLAGKGISTNKYMARGGEAERRKKFLNIPTGRMPETPIVPRSTPIVSERGSPEKQLVGYGLLEMKNQIMREGIKAGLPPNEARQEAQEWYEKERAKYAEAESLQKEGMRIKEATPTRELMNQKLNTLSALYADAVDAGDEAKQAHLIGELKAALKEDKELREVRHESAENLRTARNLREEIQKTLASSGGTNIGKVQPLSPSMTRRLNTLEADKEDALRAGDRQEAMRIEMKIRALTAPPSLMSGTELRLPSGSEVREAALARLSREQIGIIGGKINGKEIQGADERMRLLRTVKPSQAQSELEEDRKASQFLEKRTAELISQGKMPEERLRSKFRSEDEGELKSAEAYLTNIEKQATKEMVSKYGKQGREKLSKEVTKDPVQKALERQLAQKLAKGNLSPEETERLSKFTKFLKPEGGEGGE